MNQRGNWGLRPRYGAVATAIVLFGCSAWADIKGSANSNVPNPTEPLTRSFESEFGEPNLLSEPQREDPEAALKEISQQPESDQPSTKSTLTAKMPSASAKSSSYSQPQVGVDLRVGLSPYHSIIRESHRSFALALNYQPAFVQSFGYGVIGVGPTFEILDALPTHGAIIGGELRYQSRWFESQPLIPTAGYRVERWWYTDSSHPNISGWVSGPTLGLWFDMGWLDKKAARQFFSNTGIKRTYLLADFKLTKGTLGGAINVDGEQFFMGLRMEF